MSNSNLLNILEMSSTQEDRSPVFNAAVAVLEAFGLGITAQDVYLNTPPVTPTEGDSYVVGLAPTGVWTGHAMDIALYYNASWVFAPPRNGLLAYAANEDVYYRYRNGYGWETAISPSAISPTQTDFISGFFKAEEDQSIPLIINSPIAITITSTTTQSSSGTATYTFDINGTPLGGSANDVSSAEDIQNHASANVVPVGGNLNVTISNDSPAAEGVAWTVAYTYELA